MHNPEIYYTTTKTESADELWELLSPTRINEKGKNAYFKFRGHGNSDWKLIPSALREGFDKNNFIIGEIKSITDLIINEVSTLFNFAIACDSVGIPIPNDSTTFRKKHLTFFSDEDFQYISQPELWPNPKLYEIMAMAQHHGVPTRLLDWSDSPYIAAYFAASGAIVNYESSDWESQRLAIWTVRNPYIASSEKLRFIKVPGSVSKHLPSQRGSFSIHPIFSHHDDISKTLGLEEYNFHDDGFEFYKFTLPVTEAVRLLHLCKIAGFTAAELFPSADGAGRAVRETMLLTAIVKKLGINYDGTRKY